MEVLRYLLPFTFFLLLSAQHNIATQHTFASLWIGILLLGSLFLVLVWFSGATAAVHFLLTPGVVAATTNHEGKSTRGKAFTARDVFTLIKFIGQHCTQTGTD